MRARTTLILLVLTCAASACAEQEPADDEAPAAQSDTTNAATGDPAADAAQQQLVRAAERVIAFLRGEATFDAALFADSVTLYIAPEGGGATRRLSRQELATPAGWVIGTRLITPPGGAARLTTRAGRHFNCHEYPLSSRYPELATMPHVGTKLEPPASGSCLQSWNLTLVFAPPPAPPRVSAAVYDQWEW